MDNATKDQLRTGVAAWLEAEAKRKEEWDRQHKADLAWKAADARATEAKKHLGTFLGEGVESVMVRVPASERTVVVRRHDARAEPYVDVYDRDGNKVG